MKWQESGGPPLVENRPTRGFGTRLIERTLKQELDGECTDRVRPDRASLRVPRPNPADDEKRRRRRRGLRERSTSAKEAPSLNGGASP
jgi:hypothetical protein